MVPENDTRRDEAVARDGEPVLRRGRPADPAQPVAFPAAGNTQDVPENTPDPAVGPLAVQSASDAEDSLADHDEVVSVEDVPESEADRLLAENRQHRLRRLLKQCERVLLLDFGTLAMQSWPDSFTLAQARRRRDLWLFGATVSAVVFLSGMTGFVPAWVAGGGFGVFVLTVIAGVPFVRRLYASDPSYMDLLMRRQRLLKEARKHIGRLESGAGLLWQCAQMAEFNPTLRSSRYSNLVQLSERRVLARSLIRRDHVRLYLIYMLEAEKAYDRLQHSYFEGHQTAIDQGWQSATGKPGAHT